MRVYIKLFTGPKYRLALDSPINLAKNSGVLVVASVTELKINRGKTYQA
jgi:hypothetical protein